MSEAHAALRQLQRSLRLICAARPVLSSANQTLLAQSCDKPIGHAHDTDAGRIVAAWLEGDTEELDKTALAIAQR